MLCNDGFEVDGRLAASRKGMPGLKIIPESVPCDSSVMDEIEVGINSVIENIIEALTRPLTSEEQSPKAKELEKPSRIVFKGDLEEVN
ncbi:MAG: hypothetical protein ABSH06_05535, partial [Thermodesulfobacteriota bacterium]